MKIIRKSTPIILLSFYLLMILLVPFGGGETHRFAAAAGTEQNGVLNDLLHDTKFDPENYPENATDYSIHVIQIAESIEDGLVVYTHQPSQNSFDIVATQINLSLSKDVKDPRLYDLTLLSSEGVFCKYKVNDFTISKEPIRYYNLISIYREWEEKIDDGTGNDNKKEAVTFSVGKLFTVTTEGDTLVYKCEDRDVVEILDPYTGYLRYTDGFLWHKTACDSHFVAFSTDKKIDDLFEAELEYQSQTYEKFTYTDLEFGPSTYGETVDHHITLTDDEEFQKDGKWWLWGQSAEYSRIQTIDDFIAKEDLLDSVKEKLKTQKWVLRFCETDYTYQYYPYPQSAYAETGTYISNVTILRLKFKTEGVIYNLGAVSDKITEGAKPGNKPNSQSIFGSLFPDWLLWLIVGVIGILLIIVFVLFLPILKPVFGGILKILWWIITAPFRLVTWIAIKISASKKRKEEKGAAPPKSKAKPSPKSSQNKQVRSKKNPVVKHAKK